MDLTALKGRGEAERLRPDRVRNYRVKSAAGFECSECSADRGVLVVRLAEGESDDCFSTRCERHLDGLEPTPGQRAA